MMTRSGTK